MSILRLQQRKAATMLSKLLGSAIANATENEKADVDKLFVTKVVIDGGPMTEALDAALDGPRQPHQRPHLARHGRRRRAAKSKDHRNCGKRTNDLDGTENTSDRLPPRRHSRLELEVVRGEELRQVAARGHQLKKFVKKKLEPRRRRRPSRSSAPPTR